ncbi:MAG: hypothetical protein ABIR70_09355 [Bryobacteraceae bacterium]
MLTKLSLLSVGLTVALVAADFWTKPVADWTDKEMDMMLSDSPWADRMAVETGQRGNVGNADDGKGPMQGNLTAPVVVVWRTALPIRQAVARRGNTPVGEEPTVSLLLASGFPAMFRADATDAAKLAADTVIKVKGKADIHPTEVQLPAAAAAPKGAPGGPGGPGGGKGGGKGFGGGGGTFDLIFAFPKNAGLTLDDKEIEFITKVGKMNIRKKFKLKDMVVNGKLEM